MNTSGISGSGSGPGATDGGWQALNTINFSVQLDKVGFGDVEMTRQHVIVRRKKVDDRLVACAVCHDGVRDEAFCELWDSCRKGLLDVGFEFCHGKLGLSDDYLLQVSLAFDNNVGRLGGTGLILLSMFDLGTFLE